MDVQAEIPQGSILGPLRFLIYISDLPDNPVSNPKLFADDTSLFSTVTDPNVMADHINNDLYNSTWAYQWKMNFNPDTSKQAQEVTFNCIVKVTAHLQLVFNNNPVDETLTQKHLGMFLDFKLKFQDHIENMHKTIGIPRKLQNILPRRSLLTNKSFIRPNLDCPYII